MLLFISRTNASISVETLVIARTQDDYFVVLRMFFFETEGNTSRRMSYQIGKMKPLTG